MSMKGTLLIVVALCVCTLAMVPNRRFTREANVKLCNPQTPCSWDMFKADTKEIYLNMINTYCTCAPNEVCVRTDEDEETFAGNGGTLGAPQESGFSPLAAPFQTRMGNDLLTLMSQHEPRQADTAPSTTDIDDVLMNLRLNGSDLLFDDPEQTNTQNFFMGGSRADTVTPSPSSMWAEGTTGSGARNGEMIDTFDFLIKSISSANNYVSMLTREQLYVLRSIRPSLLYEFLQEVAKVRSDKRMRRALPNECAFCKNNGENEECYSSHALKDWRGRVLCPVLRAFRCPRCGATGDRAHTIKYCPENVDGGLERSGSLSSRRRMASAPLLMSRASPAPASPSPATPLPHSSLWSNFGIN